MSNSSSRATKPDVPAQAASLPIGIAEIFKDPREIIQLNAFLREWFVTFYVSESMHSTFSEFIAGSHVHYYFCLSELLESRLIELMKESK